MGVAANTAEDVIHDNKSVKESLVDNALNEISRFGGGGRGARKRTSTLPINRKGKKKSRKQEKDALDVYK